MDRLFWSGPWLVLFCILFHPELCHAFPDKQKLEHEERVLAIMDPIDLQTQHADLAWGEFLRKNFQLNLKWKVISHDTMLAKFKDYKIDPKFPCHEFQCAFDAGNVLGAEFVLFGSITNLDDIYAFTFNLVHVPTSQVVWSKVGDVRKRQSGTPASALESTLAQMRENLVPESVRTGRREKRGLLSVLDLSAAASTPSRMMAERVATHLYASRSYDLMGKKEMEELLLALGINKGGFNPTDSSIFWLGGKMDITHLVYSRLLNDKGAGLKLQLALYDVTAKKKVREWPAKSTEDFRKLLEFEDKFFASLFKSTEYEITVNSNPATARHWSMAGAGISLTMSAIFGFLAFESNLDAENEFNNFQNARSRESAKELQAKVLDKEKNTMVMGLLSGLSLVGTGGFLIFSF